MNTCTVCILENAKFQCRTLTIVHEISYFCPFGRPQSGSVIIQLMTELDVSNN